MEPNHLFHLIAIVPKADRKNKKAKKVDINRKQIMHG